MRTQESKPIRDLLKEVAGLIRNKATGTYCLVTDENRFAMVSLSEGGVVDINYKGKHNDDALPLLGPVRTARATFQEGSVRHGQAGPPSADTVQRLLAADFQAPANDAPAPGGQSLGQREQRVVREIALSYLGPIAEMVCAEAFANGNGLDDVIRHVASNLPSGAEGNRFASEVRQRLGGG